jgi:hypothetical protein
MSRAGFVVAFEGPSVLDGTIDVRDLAPALLALGHAVDAANRVINGDKVPARVEARAVSAGCFEVSLEVVLQGWEYIRGILLSDDAQAAAALLNWLGIGASAVGVPAVGLIGLRRWMAGRTPTLVERSGSSVTVIIGDERLTVPTEVMRLYQDTAVNASMGKLLDTLEGRGIDRIEFRKFPGGPAEQTVTAEDRAAFAPPEAPEETVVDETRRMALSIRSLAFQEGNKWRLFDGQNVITATIDDKDFIASVDNNEIRFAKSDILICEVRSVQKQTSDGLKTEHFVRKVLEYKAAPTQINLL